MSYEVTATRRRPQRFEDLAGQEFVAETLRNSIQSQKIAHAYLFSGPRGCGKTSTARILAKALNCTHGPTATPCGECQQCKEITKGACTDVIEIDGASNTSVNDVRQIKDEVLFPPQSCRYKIYIIDEVHMLSTSAFNALLKTIEEPPPYVIFIFATTELQKVPATIKSRCQQFNFRLVPIERVKQLLEEACKDINIEAEDEALYWIARESTGSVRDSYTLFDQVAAFSGDKITYEKIRDKLGLVGVDRLNAIFEDCAQNKTQDVLSKLDEFLQNGISIEQLISNATDYLRSLLLIKNGITKEALLGQAAERYSAVVLERWNSVQIERGLSLLLQLYRDIRYSLSPRYELELAFSRLSWLSQYVSPAEVKAAIDSAHALLAGAPAPAPGNAFARPQQTQFAQPAQQAPQTQAAQPVQAQPARPAFGFSALAGQQPSAPQTAQQVPPAQQQPAQAARTPTMPMFSALSGNTGMASAPQASSQQAAPAHNAASVPQNDVSDSGQPLPPLEMESYDDGGMNGGAEQGAPSFSTGGAVPPEQAGGKSENGIREQLISKLTVSDTLLAALLMRTENWVQSGNVISCEVDSAFLKSQLDAQLAKIASALTTFIGQPAEFTVNVHKEQKVSLSQDAPRPVALVCSMFKGVIVGKSQKVPGSMQRKQEQNSGSAESESDDEASMQYEEENENDESV